MTRRSVRVNLSLPPELVARLDAQRGPAKLATFCMWLLATAVEKKEGGK